MDAKVVTAPTEGPWKAAPFSSIVGCPITAQPDPKRNTVVIAGVHGAFGDDYLAEVEANARLIVAACNSYQRHCPDPVSAAEGDLLGRCLEALRECRDQFQKYATLHSIKGTADADAKAMTNRAFAEKCDAILSQAREVK